MPRWTNPVSSYDVWEMIARNVSKFEKLVTEENLLHQS
jgi:hypothetical protein